MESITEALEWAADYCERTIFKVPVNPRGYPVDGYKAPSVEERASIIAQVAQTAFDNQHTEYTLMHARLTLLQTLIKMLPISKSDAGPAGIEISKRMEEWGYAI